MKKGYFKANDDTTSVGFTYNRTSYELKCFCPLKIRYYEPTLAMEMSAPEFKLSFFVKKILDNKYYELEDDVVSYVLDTFKDCQLEWVEVDN